MQALAFVQLQGSLDDLSLLGAQTPFQRGDWLDCRRLLSTSPGFPPTMTATNGRRDTLDSINAWVTAVPLNSGPTSKRSTVSKKTTVKSISESIGEKSEKKEAETPWKSIYLLTAICMFCGVQFSIFFPTLWPFLNKVDPTASETFFGVITAAFSVGQGLASPIFGFWMNRSKSVRQPMICGILVMIISNIIFCFVEAFKEKERRWVMMVARFFIGLGAGTVGVMRAYASTASSLKDRARAITFIQASYVIGMTIGPGVPVAFAPIGFPGWAWGPLHVNMYTAPAWFACLICIISLVLLIILLEENYAGIQEKGGDDYTPLPKFDVFAVSVCVVTQFTLMFIITNLETIGSMYAMAMWSWTTSQAVVYTGILQAVNGAASVLVYAGFVVKLGDYVSRGRERIWTMIGLALGLLYHVATFPYPVGETLKWKPAVHSTEDDCWDDVREKKNAGKCVVIGEGVKKDKQWARILNYRRVWNSLYSLGIRNFFLEKIIEAWKEVTSR
ncbi:hypothetical protein Y032_0020g221 [Ancylostoma ceylanicum]|uniref:Major facilitator superfamily (MFS) profile domain-containing protein n=1 Tax=Ancylostoma ceylanicum TaxID=53326 RepID=A0A016V282_9BILA|nr:hypothetical protein Y032_0020g221 [Ancylostoma ceylanicum]